MKIIKNILIIISINFFGIQKKWSKPKSKSKKLDVEIKTRKLKERPMKIKKWRKIEMRKKKKIFDIK